MKPITASLIAITASGAFAQQQTWNISAPFNLKIADSTNTTLNGQRLFACHSGAIENGLCLSEMLGPNEQNLTNLVFYHNTTGTPGVDVGLLMWDQPVGSFALAEHMHLDIRLNSNVATALLWSGPDTTGVGFHEDGKMYIPAYWDDANNTYNERSIPVDLKLSQWHACWAQVGFYWYHALTWVTAGTPHNPTCVPINVYKVNL